MKKSAWILLVVTLAMIGATGGFLFHVKGNQKLGKPGVVLGNFPLFDVRTNRVADTTVILPENIPGYFSAPLPITDIELGMLPKDTTFGRRRYWADGGANADVNVVLMGQDRTSIHKPQFCLVGQGWNIEKSEVVNIKMQRPYVYELPVMKLTAGIRTKGDNGNPMDIRGIYVYWFVADNKLTASHDSRMWSMAKNLLETGTLERWAYISYFSRCFPGQEEATFKRLEEFIVKSAPEFQIPAGKPSSNSAGKIQTAFK